LPEWETTEKIIGSFFRTWNALGYGFLESVYRRAFAIELGKAGLAVRQEVPIEAICRGQSVGHFRLDLLVESRVVIEVKASQVLGPTDKQQLLNYLTVGGFDVGLLLHFGPSPKFHRAVSPRIIADSEASGIRQLP